MDYKYINRIDSPADLKKVALEELPEVCAELRQFIIDALSKNPGHLGSSLGTIELTVALHYVFDTPNDKLVWDVGHQAYAHKILTGRRDRFHTNRQFKGLSPFTNPKESEYDAFIAGHASNSISAALGLDIADRFAVGSETASAVRPASPVRRNVVAIIGDGAMTGGLAFEGLNNTSMDKNNLLIVLNDNHMAIDPLKGGFTQYLVDLTTSATYNKWRWRLYRLGAKLHLINEDRRQAILRRNNNLKAALSKQANNIFTGLNIRYFGPTDGHDVVGLVRILSEIKNHRGPKVLHIITKKGKGYAPAENDQTIWHAPGEFNVETGLRSADVQSGHVQSTQDMIQPLWQEVFGETLLELAKKNKKIVGVTPAMPSGCSMSIMQKEIPDRVYDVGIAEGHAVTFSAGLAKEGILPYCNIYSTFMQRAYDNIVHDVALQNLHVVFCIDRAGIVGNDGATHHGLLDLAYLRPIPNMQICAPRTADDLRQMMTLAETMEGPVAIRYPRGRTPNVQRDNALESDKGTMYNVQGTKVEYGKGVKLRDGKDLAVLTIGSIGNTMSEAIDQLSTINSQLSIAHYDMRWLKPMDEEILHEVGKRFKTIVTAEDGVIAGGLGSAVLEWMADYGYTPHVIRLGVRDQFVEHGSTKELYQLLKLDKEGLCESLLRALEK